MQSKDALDTYLVACLMIHALRASNEYYYIVSNDQGYLGGIRALQKYRANIEISLISITKEKSKS